MIAPFPFVPIKRLQIICGELGLELELDLVLELVNVSAVVSETLKGKQPTEDKKYFIAGFSQFPVFD